MKAIMQLVRVILTALYEFLLREAERGRLFVSVDRLVPMCYCVIECTIGQGTEITFCENRK